ncbi:MAG TPA: DMT family transporter [Paracoccaceae bacterium]|nr:DMT family transporter [Paracoccaceae bacterium]
MNPARGIGLKVLAVALFMGMAICIKVVSANMPPGQIVFFRSFLGLPVILGWLWHARQLHDGLKTAHPLGHLWRGLLGVSAMGCSFTALGLLPLPDVTAISYASPVLVTIFAAMFLGETVRAYRIGAVMLGLAGVLIVLAPRLSVLNEATPWQTVGALTALMGAVFGALAQVTVRSLLETETTAGIVFYFSLSCSVLALLTLPWGWVWPTPFEAALLVAIGVLGGFGQIAQTECYRHAEVAVIAPFEYTSMLLALAAGYFLFSEVPTGAMLAGAALVVVAGLIIVFRERQLGIERRKARQTATPQG